MLIDSLIFSQSLTFDHFINNKSCWEKAKSLQIGLVCVKFMSKNWVASSLGQFSRGWPVFPKSKLSGSDSILVLVWPPS